MSSIIKPITAEELKFLVEKHLPDTHWTFGGAFRFDASLQMLVDNLSKSFARLDISDEKYLP